MSINEIIKDRSTVVVDVRSREEFMGGNVADSINIPLQEIQQRAAELKNITGNIVLCCASGNRSGMATQFLKGMGFANVYNGGGWTEVNYYKNN